MIACATKTAKRQERWIDQHGEQVDELDNGKHELPKRYRNRKPAGDLAAAASKEQQSARGFVCPRCQCNATHVVDSHEVSIGRRRLRVCTACGYRIQTHEVATSDGDLDKILNKMLELLR